MLLTNWNMLLCWAHVYLILPFLLLLYLFYFLLCIQSASSLNVNRHFNKLFNEKYPFYFIFSLKKKTRKWVARRTMMMKTLSRYNFFFYSRLFLKRWTTHKWTESVTAKKKKYDGIESKTQFNYELNWSN